ncbi:alpha/beta hydrolase [Leptolyngbya sp. BL0902]|uniref:alpha/beta fold hydrolase n=1 Tax=Leptolyngbya sp. BL0902 TaxID=1115757 RepID=UPI0018E7B400|nr:alpha/beta hydrolase [Leptolyngbya sp. BL0902]QQE67280.1 alpha/beta hydrolase [Leptolyngbya sp. BL0902]
MTSLPPAQVYDWKTYPCTYTHYPALGHQDAPPLLLIHPIGVGLAGWFWHRTAQTMAAAGNCPDLYVPDLLGCGHSAKPKVAYYAEDWADQLAYFLCQVVQRPVVLVVQGAALPIGLHLLAHPHTQGYIQGLALSGPPGMKLMTMPTTRRRQTLLWNLLFSGPVGVGFFRYARREAFLQSFSRRQLFATEADIDREWLDHLLTDAQDTGGRYAVYSFLAGFWRQDYTALMAAISIPTLVIFGESASGINQLSRTDPPRQRLTDYLHHIPHATGKIIPGRNVLPYESTAAFVETLQTWLTDQSWGASQ